MGTLDFEVVVYFSWVSVQCMVCYVGSRSELYFCSPEQDKNV